MLSRFKVPLSWKELAANTVREIWADDLLNLAAQQAYYFFFALFPALLTFISIASFFPIENLTGQIVTVLGRFAPPEALTIITDQITKISQTGHGGILTFAFLLTIWSSSGAMVSIISTLNAAYDLMEERPLWKVRLIAVLLTLGVAFFILISMALLLVGPTLAEHLADSMHLGAVFKWTWWVLNWPVVFLLVATAMGLVYYFAPDADQDWIWITPGSVLATLLWVVVSLGLKLYIQYFGNYNETYGTLGGFILLLTWFYLSGLAILIGAELNSEIEHASIYGKDIGEKVPGVKRKIGAAAEREYEERKARGEVVVPPFDNDANCDVDAKRTPKSGNGLRPSDLMIGAALLAPSAVKIAKAVRKRMHGERSRDADAA